MLHLGQFHLQFAFVGAGTLGEDIENESGAIQHAAFELLFQVAFLAGRQWMVEENNFCLVLANQLGNFFQLAGTYEETGIDVFQVARNQKHRTGTCRKGKFLKFPGIWAVRLTVQRKLDQNGYFPAVGTLEKNIKTSKEPDRGT
jgi:hypothetical protein